MLKFTSNVCRLTNSGNQNVLRCLPAPFHTTATNSTFWEKEKRAGYNKKVSFPSKKELILNGLKELKSEMKMWKDEMKEKIEMDPIVVYRPGEVDIVYDFKNQQDLEKWVATSDSDHNEGKSTAKFELTNSSSGLFHGYVDSEHLKDGKIKRTGYANIRTMRVRKSFKRETTYNWTMYNTLVLKIRGDGRSYLINLNTEGYFDLMWNDAYHYALYTRGGPHWQYVKIPFSKFFRSSKGRIQDKQCPIPLDLVTHIGFSVSAKGQSDGPFHLEVAHIGLEFNPANMETFAYEMYKQDKYIVAT